MSEPMDLSRRTIGQRIARAARAFEKRQTKHGRIWVVVFMNEDTIVIALHGSLTAAEKAQSQSLAGAARVWEFHRQMFTNASAALFRKIKSITGMEVRDTTAEIDPTTGHVVQIFTTDTVAEDFPLPSSNPAGTRAPGARFAPPEGGQGPRLPRAGVLQVRDASSGDRHGQGRGQVPQRYPHGHPAQDR